MQEVGGSIPPGSTTFPVPMLRFARLLMVVALLLVLAGLVSGFAALFAGHHDTALWLLGLVPAGVLLGFTGMVVIVLLEPRG